MTDTTTTRDRRSPRLEHVQLTELFDRFAATRDPHVREELVGRHRWLARVCAHQMRRRTEPLEELEQVALIGIYKAIERFDPSRGVQFRTYASATVVGELRRHYRDASWSARVPRRMKELHLQVQRASADLAPTLGRQPTVDDISAHLRVPPDDVLEAMEAGQALRPQSLSAGPVESLGRRSGREDAAIEARASQIDDRAAVDQLLERLDPQKRRVVVLRFFEHMTQEQIAVVLGVSQVQISRLLRAALVQLRDAGVPMAAMPPD